MTTKKLKDYALDRMFEVFGQSDDYEMEYSMLMNEISSLRSKGDVDEYIDLLLEQYKDHYEDYMPKPKAWE